MTTESVSQFLVSAALQFSAWAAEAEHSCQRPHSGLRHTYQPHHCNIQMPHTASLNNFQRLCSFPDKQIPYNLFI